MIEIEKENDSNKEEKTIKKNKYFPLLNQFTDKEQFSLLDKVEVMSWDKLKEKEMNDSVYLV